MDGKSRPPPPHLRHPLPGASAVHPELYHSVIRPPAGGFPPYEMLPPAEILERKLSAQHVEIEKLATENRRLAATHGTLRQDLGAAKQKLQLVHAQIEDMKSEQEQQTRSILAKMSIMEAELEGAEPVKVDLQQAHAEAQNLIAARQELISKVQQLTHDLQIAHSEAQQIPPLLSQLDGLRQEYQHCRAAYDYEKKLHNDHLESLQAMEKNFMEMSREVEKLRAELTNSAFDPRIGGPGSGSARYHESVSMGNHASSQNVYGVVKGQFPPVGGGTGVGAPSGAAGPGGNFPHIPPQSAPTGSGPAAGDASRGSSYVTADGTGYVPHIGHVSPGFDHQKGKIGAGTDAQKIPSGPNYDSHRGPTTHSYDPHTGAGGAPAFDSQRGLRSDNQRGPVYEAQRALGYDSQRGPIYEMQRGSGNDAHRVANTDVHKGTGYHPHSGSTGSQGQASTNNTPYLSSTPSTRALNGYDSAPRGTDPNHR